ncbi:hypothetical protein FJT64_004504 [Amphibalanus amphitrite]|uniref:Uncharacterized protein n=1 Tax=Amphibalanus amphitrite TaxID=1232801 RepID=A0A6A4VVF2_AMPAM|nr:hypothetical protein FJT64_004504 [Amphibalanus amphitrite]
MRDRPKLTVCPVKLRSYTGELIPVLGEFVTDVVYHGASHSRLPVIVVKGSAPCLLGRNWLERMKICWFCDRETGPVGSRECTCSDWIRTSGAAYTGQTDGGSAEAFL